MAAFRLLICMGVMMITISARRMVSTENNAMRVELESHKGLSNQSCVQDVLVREALINIAESAAKGDKPAFSDVKAFLLKQNADFANPAPLWPIYAKPNALVFVIGDLHGELVQLHHIMQRIAQIVRDSLRDSGRTPEFASGSKYLVCMDTVYYVFLGDYVDRAPDPLSDLKTALLVLLYRSLCPAETTGSHGVLLLRGNHEDRDINVAYGFSESLGSLSRGVSGKNAGFALFVQAWQTLPLAAAVNQKVLLMHGGLSSAVVETNYADGFTSFATDIHTRFSSKMPKATCSAAIPLCELMWSDPGLPYEGEPEVKGWNDSPRGLGQEFGADVAKQFMDSSGIELILRGHQSEEDGYYQPIDNVFTIFSAASYPQRQSNSIGGFAHMRIPAAGHEGTGASAFQLKIELHKLKSKRGPVEVEPAGTKTHGEYSSFMQQRQLVVAAVHRTLSRRNVSTDQSIKSFTPDDKLSQGSMKMTVDVHVSVTGGNVSANRSIKSFTPEDKLAQGSTKTLTIDQAQCEALSDAVQEEAHKEVSQILHGEQASHAQGRAKLLDQVTIDVDELGEAWPLIKDPKERMKVLCEAIMAGKMVEQALLKSGATTPDSHEDRILREEVARREEQLRVQ